MGVPRQKGPWGARRPAKAQTVQRKDTGEAGSDEARRRAKRRSQLVKYDKERLIAKLMQAEEQVECMRQGYERAANFVERLANHA